MKDNYKIICLLGLLLVVFLFFIFYKAGSNWTYILPRRFNKAFAMLLVGVCIGYSSIVFQTISFNRILTPGIMGFDYLYLFIQTLVVYTSGGMALLITNSYINFIVSMVAMQVFIALLYRYVLKRNSNIYFFILIGLICGTLFKSLSTFMQMLIDPNEFAIVQDKMFASFNNIPVELINLCFAVLIVLCAIGFRYFRYLDVMLLGKEQALSLGVNYTRIIKYTIFTVTILVSIATSLVGPITFLGILVSNLAYRLCKTYKHAYTVTTAMILSGIFIIAGQLVIERVFNFSITISVIINFTGGLYFIYLLLREANDVGLKQDL